MNKIFMERDSTVKCYKRKKSVPQGEAIQQSEHSGGSERSYRESISYWLCLKCHEKEKKQKGIASLIVFAIIIAIVGWLIYNKSRW